MARKTTAKKRDFQEILNDILEAENKTYEDAGVARTFVVSFPNHKKPPLLGRLGAYLITKVGGIIQIQFHDLNKQ